MCSVDGVVNFCVFVWLVLFSFRCVSGLWQLIVMTSAVSLALRSVLFVAWCFRLISFTHCRA